MKYILLLVVLVFTTGMGCDQIPRDEHPERTCTKQRWNADGLASPEPCEPALQSGRQPVPSEAPNE